MIEYNFYLQFSVYASTGLDFFIRHTVIFKKNIPRWELYFAMTVNLRKKHKGIDK